MEPLLIFAIFEEVLFWMLWCAGAVMNTVLMLVFIRHPETRTPPNVLLINLCVADLLYLLNFPAGKLACLVGLFDEWRAKWLLFMHSFVTALCIVSIAAINIQRYVGITKFKNRPEIEDKKYTKSLLLVVCLWMLAGGLARLEVYLTFLSSYAYIYVITGNVTFRLVMYGFVPAAIIGGFHAATFCFIERRTRRMPGVESEAVATLRKRRMRSARIVKFLSGTFYLTFLALFIFYFLLVEHPHNALWLTLVHSAFVYLLNISNPLMNPLALYIASSQLKRLMKGYLCCCCDHIKASRRSEVALIRNADVVDEEHGATELHNLDNRSGLRNNGFVRDSA